MQSWLLERLTSGVSRFNASLGKKSSWDPISINIKLGMVTYTCRLSESRKHKIGDFSPDPLQKEQEEWLKWRHSCLKGMKP
jgi:hypothetical protein